jgi:hypothetical protein
MENGEHTGALAGTVSARDIVRRWPELLFRYMAK